MNNPTDTNQTSEDDKAIMIGFLYGIQSDFLSADEVRHRMAGFRHTQGYKDAIELINTQKRLYAESVIGEDDAIDNEYGSYSSQEVTNSDRNELREEQRARIK